MAKLIRSLVVIGAIVALSPVHEGASLRGDAAAHGRSLLTTLMPEADLGNISATAHTAVNIAKHIKDLDPATRDMMLQLAAAQIGSTADQRQRVAAKAIKSATPSP